MKTRILIYGDSNTWGSGAFGGRYDTDKQWPNILQSMLGVDYEVIQEGLCARIAGDHDSKDLHRNGRRGFEIVARSAAPYDYLIIALGTNDLKEKYELTSKQIVNDLIWLEDRSRELVKQDDDFYPLKGVLYLGISNFYKNKKFKDEDPLIIHEIHGSLQQKGKHLVIPHMLEHSRDGLHYSEADHQKVAEMLYKKFKEIE